MTPKNPTDRRPFQPRAELERERALEARYGRLAIREVLAAVEPKRPDDPGGHATDGVQATGR